MKTSPLPPPPTPIHPNWAWHYRQLHSLRDRLLDSRAALLAEAADPLEQPGMDMADSATDSFDHDLALGLLSYEQDALSEIEAALQRILDGTYGLCEETSLPIPADRLEAIPWTRFTKEAEERFEHLEREGLARPPRLGPLRPREEPEKAFISALDAEEPENRFGAPVSQAQSAVDLEAFLPSTPLSPSPPSPVEQ